jgi:hypothetical protein
MKTTPRGAMVTLLPWSTYLALASMSHLSLPLHLESGMVTKTELTDYLHKTIAIEPWTVDEGRIVPATSDIALNNSARRFELATFLYADLNGSTKMVEELGWGRSAEIYKTYLYCASPPNTTLRRRV